MISAGGGAVAAEQLAQQGDGAGLVERLVAVAALGRLHATGAPVDAPTRSDHPQGCGQVAVRCVVGELGDAGAAGVAVVDQYGGPSGVGMAGGGQPAHVPPVAQAEQSQHADGSMFGCVERARQHVRVEQPGVDSAV